MDQCPIQGESKTLIRLTLEKPEISADSMGHLARKGFSSLSYHLNERRTQYLCLQVRDTSSEAVGNRQLHENFLVQRSEDTRKEMCFHSTNTVYDKNGTNNFNVYKF